jgi:hypothetical protein
MDDLPAWDSVLAAYGPDPHSEPARICRLCIDALAVTGVGISMITDTGNRGVVCATDETAARIEELQVTLGQGPCMDAVTSGAPVLVADVARGSGLAVERWPAFLDSAYDAGVRALFAFPLRIGAIGVGAMDFYRNRSGDLTDGELAAALMAADAAAMAVLRLGAANGDPFADDPEARTNFGFEVHQAAGMIQVQLGVPSEAAFLALRARAFASDRPLSDVARDVVERRLRFSPEDS